MKHFIKRAGSICLAIGLLASGAVIANQQVDSVMELPGAEVSIEHLKGTESGLKYFYKAHRNKQAIHRASVCSESGSFFSCNNCRIRLQQEAITRVDGDGNVFVQARAQNHTRTWNQSSWSVNSSVAVGYTYRNCSCNILGCRTRTRSASFTAHRMGATDARWPWE